MSNNQWIDQKVDYKEWTARQWMEKQRQKAIEKSKQKTTSDLEDFCYVERMELIRLLMAWNEHGLPEDFDSEGVLPMFNKDSGNVFLTNSEYQVAMMNGDKLESWYYCHNCGHEGFADDCTLCEEGCNQCQ